MKLELEFGITGDDAHKMSNRLDIIAANEKGAYQDAARYASELLMEIADKLKEVTQ